MNSSTTIGFIPRTTTCSSFPGSSTSPEFLLAFVRRVHAQLTEFRDEGCGPAINVALPDRLTHALHAQFLFLRLHLKGGANGLSRLVDVVGIYLQGVVQLVGGASKATQD